MSIIKNSFILFLILLLNISCSNTATTKSDKKNLKTYFQKIEKQINMEFHKNPRVKYKRKLTKEETKNTSYFLENYTITENENGYQNIYNAFDERLMASFQLSSKGKIHGVFKLFDKDENLTTIGYLEKKAVKSGLLKEYYPTGKLKSETLYYKNNILGTSKEYYESGKIFKIIPYKNNKVDGRRIFYYENGNVLEDYYYKNGKEEGKGVIYYENGRIKLIEYYKNGKREGQYTEYYENGNVKLIKYYHDGKEEGEYIKYYDNGKIQEKGNMKNGVIVGKIETYSKTGVKKDLIPVK